MTVSNLFFNYQSANTSYKYYNKGCSPAIKSIREYVLKQWGGMNLGDFGVRPVRGGSSISTHAFGAAWDWRYQDPGPGRSVLFNEVIALLINYSAELGVQSIHDYVGGQIWHADRHAWKPQVKSSANGMGQSWAKWIHVEVHPNSWTDGRPVETKLGVGPDPGGDDPGFPPFNPEIGEFSLYPIAKKQTIQQGATGDLVRYLQGVLRIKLDYAIGVDGNWGPITNNFVIWFQASSGLVADGIVGRNTWQEIDRLAVS